MIYRVKASFALKSRFGVPFSGSFKNYSTLPEDQAGDKLTPTDESNHLRESTKTVIKEDEDIGKIDFQSILKYLDQNKERDLSVHKSFRSCCDLLSQGETAKAFEQLKELADTKSLDVAQFLVGFLYKIWKFDFDNAFKYFMLAADQNHSGALYQIGLHYRFVKKDNQNCVKYLTLASDYNHSKAQYMLGLLYELGESDVEKDLKKSHEYFLKSASTGCYYAQHALGIHYTYGTSITQKNPSKGADFYLLAANQGYHAAQFSYGYALFHGRGVEPNKSLACKYYKMASDQGNLFARVSLGHCYEKGDGIEKDLLKAYDLYRRTGSPKALNRMALLHYYENPPIAHDLDKAIELFLEAEAEGSTLASQNLGNVYYFKRKNGEKALQYYLKAVDAGHAHACKQVARIYKKGFDGIQKNTELAVKYYKMSLERKDDVGTLVELADLYNFDTRDYDKAFEVYKRAAEKNSDHAYLILGDFYKYGKGVDKIDIQKAFECYIASAKLGNVAGCIIVSKAYLSGIGLEQNIELAVQYLQNACDQNSTDAQLKLGFLYINGPMSLRDVNKGIEMFKLSASQSNSKACYELSKIYASGLHGVTQDTELSKFYFEQSQKYGTFTYMNQPNFQNKNSNPTTPNTTSSNYTQTLGETIYNNNNTSTVNDTNKE